MKIIERKIYLEILHNVRLTPDIKVMLQIKDAYPRFIIARIRKPRYDYQGIQIIDLAEWLTTKG